LGERIISGKIKPALAALCIIFIITAAALIVYYNSVMDDKNIQISVLQTQVDSLNVEVDRLNATIQKLNTELDQKNRQVSNLNSQITSLNNQIAGLNSQINDLTSQISNLTSQVTNKPNLIAESFTVEDDRSSIPYNLHIAGRVNNTGGSTAYNAFLHVVAFNAEGLAIDDFYYFGGITGHMSLGLDFRLNYTGSPIQRWSISPIWTDKLTTVSNGSFS
jgi:uncharacterized protein YoxC